MEFITEFGDVWASATKRHAVLIHMPIALLTLGVPLLLVLAATAARSITLRWTSLVVYLLATGTALMAKMSGENAHDAVEDGLSQIANDLLHEHEEIGEQVWFVAALTSVVILVCTVTKKKVRIGAAWIAFLCSVLSAAWVANAAHHGGKLVYDHGVGMLGSQVVVGDIDATEDSSETAHVDARRAYFSETIAPILSNNCWKCHHTDNALKGKAAGLDLTRIDGILKGGESGPAIIPGSPHDSLLYQAITWNHEYLQMPPKQPQLDASIIESLEQWIREGAVWDAQRVAILRDADGHD